MKKDKTASLKQAKTNLYSQNRRLSSEKYPLNQKRSQQKFKKQERTLNLSRRTSLQLNTIAIPTMDRWISKY